MNTVSKFAALIGMALTLAPMAAVAQAPADQLAAATTSTVIPPDQQPTKEQIAKLFAVMHLQDQITALHATLAAQARQQAEAYMQRYLSEAFKGHDLTDGENAQVKSATDRFVERLLASMTAQQEIEEMEAAYQRHLTLSDVDALTAFYSSPAAQHLIAIRPVVLQEYAAELAALRQQQSQRIMDELAAEMRGIFISAPDQPAKK